MADYKGFDLNYLDTPKPWAPRESSAWEDLIDTVVGDAITVGKEVSGHQHNKIYSPIGVAGIEIGAAGDAQILSLTTEGVVTNLATGSLQTVAKLPINLGGTNSDVALNNGRVMISNGGSIVESVITTSELALLDNMVSVSTGISNNDKLVTQGYVDDVASGLDEFIELSDTPINYTGSANKILAVNGVPDGINFISVVPVAQGGTNSSTALNNDRVMISSGGAIIESSAITTSELGLLDGIISVTTGSADNDKFVTQGYVDDNAGATTFLALSDTPGSYNTGRVLFESGSAVTDSTKLAWDDTNSIFDMLNNTSDNSCSSLRIRKSRGGGAYSSGDFIGQIIVEGYNGASWDTFGKTVYKDAPASSPIITHEIGTTLYETVESVATAFYPNDNNPLYIKQSGYIGVMTANPLNNIGSANGDLAAYGHGLHIVSDDEAEMAFLVLEGERALDGGTIPANGLVMCDRTAGSDNKIAMLGNGGGVIAFHSLNDDQSSYLSYNIPYILTMDMDTGRIGVGTPTPDPLGYSHMMEITKASGHGGLALSCFSESNNHCPMLDFRKSATAIIHSNSIVADNEFLGNIRFIGNDGSDFNNDAANIIGQVDGTSGSDDVPGRIGFWTHKSGVGGSAERIRIANDGGLFAYYLKSGTTQGGAGAATDELWHDTTDNTIKIGV